MEFSEKLIQLRKEKGWTQAVAARNINIQQSYLSKLENGRYIPSEEVIEKLCKAYDIPRTSLSLPKPGRIQHAKYWLIGALTGLVITLFGQLGLVFSQTYYTYKVTPLEEVTSVAENISYHLSDEYNGEKYVTTFDSTTYEYELIARRDISRKENRWLIALGLILIFISLGYFIIQLYLKKRPG
jgi:transcriptional regulator with XRE-family HTH domain